MFSPRWRKVMRDILRNPSRTALVVMSIAVGIVAMTMVLAGFSVVATELPEQFEAINPAHATLFAQPFGPEMVDSVARMPQVGLAEGERRESVQVQKTDGTWQPLTLRVINDFDDQSVDMVKPWQGSFDPGKTELLVERTSLAAMGREVGDTITVDVGDNTLKQMQIVGLTHDMNEVATNLSGIVSGYISMDALEKLGFQPYYDEMAIRVAGDGSDRAHNEVVAQAVQDRMEKAGLSVYRTNVPKPGEHQMMQFLQPMLIILGVMGVLSLLLSAFLVVNIITALLAQQTRQIGVMKSVGATGKQVAWMYVVMVAIFGLLALMVAIPLGAVVTSWFVGLAADLVNFNVTSAAVPTPILLLEAFVAIAVPVLGALTPILRGSQITVREAISDYGVATSGMGHSWLDRTLESIKFLSRPVLLSLRNTFRRKGRLILTLTTLTLASAIFIGVFGVRASLFRTMDDSFTYWNYDIRINLARQYRADYLEANALEAPGVTEAEAWGFGSAIRDRADDTQSDAFRVIAPPPESQMLSPDMLEGRWLLPDDENAIVINSDLLKDEPDLAVGDTIKMEMNGREDLWTIVGIARSVLEGSYAYINYPYFAEMTRQVGMANVLNIRLADASAENQALQSLALEKYFTDQGFQVRSVESTAVGQEQTGNRFGILISFLAIMALTLAIVGGLGLMGTMSINVLERRREIGVMRSIGASTFSVMQIVIIEGVLIGVMSWAIGAILAYPIARVLSRVVGAAFIHSDLTFNYSTGGAFLWLCAVIGIASIASIIPARSAARLTVREVLAYE